MPQGPHTTPARLGHLLLYTGLLWLTLCFGLSAYAGSTRVTVGIVASNEPYSSLSGRTPKGFSVDVLKQISETTGLDFDYRVGSWSDIYAAFLRGELDVIDEISWRQDREKLMRFTDPYHIRTTAVMQHKGHPLGLIESAADLKGLRVGVLKDIYYRDFLVAEGIEVIEYDLQAGLVQALAFGWVDAVIGPEITLKYLARQAGFFQIESNSIVPLNGMETEDFRLAVLHDKPELYNTLQAGLQRLDPQWLDELSERWEKYDGQTPIQSPQLQLSAEQKAYLQQLPPLRVGMMRDYAPFSFSEGGRVQGLSADVLYRLQDMTGLEFIPVADHWSNLLSLFRQGDLDIIANISDLPERRRYTRFTQAYHRIPNVAFTRDANLRLEKPSDLNGLRIALGDKVFYAPQMKALFGERAITYTEQVSMFQALDNGQVDVVVTSLMNGNHWIRELGLTGLRVAGELQLPGFKGEDLRLGVQPEYAPLQSILDQALQHISPAEKRVIENRWLGVQSREGPRRTVLSEQEQRYLQQKNNQLRYCISPDHYPLESLGDDGRHLGMSADLLQAFERYRDIRFQLYATESYNQSIAALKQGQCDFMPMALTGSGNGLLFSNNWHNASNVILGRLDAPFIDQMSELDNKPLGISADNPLIPLLHQRYAHLQLIPVTDSLQGLQQVRSGRLYGFIGTLAHSRHLLQQEGLADIRVLGRLPLDSNYSIAVSQEQDALLSVMQKLLKSLGDQEMKQIENNWQTVKLEQSINYSRLWQLGGGFALILLALFFWNRKLGSLNQQLQQANARLAEMSSTDQLTGLGNRNAFQQVLQQLAQQSNHESSAQTGLAVLDADLFKAVNDTYGHSVGDRCLQHLARLMRQHFDRPGDHLIRFGGEEFIIISPATDAGQLSARLDQLRQAVCRQAVMLDDNSPLFISISIGLYIGDNRQLQPEPWLQKADQALYRAKSLGRNRLEHYRPQQPEAPEHSSAPSAEKESTD